MNIWIIAFLGYFIVGLIAWFLGYLRKEEGKNFLGLRLRRAWMYEDNGQFVGQCRIDPSRKTFDYKKHSFNYPSPDSTVVKRPKLFYEIWYYHYNINNPDPLKIGKKVQPILDSSLYNVALKTKVAVDLNNLNKGGLLALLNPKVIIILIVLALVAYYLMTGHTIT